MPPKYAPIYVSDKKKQQQARSDSSSSSSEQPQQQAGQKKQRRDQAKPEKPRSDSSSSSSSAEPRSDSVAQPQAGREKQRRDQAKPEKQRKQAKPEQPQDLSEIFAMDAGDMLPGHREALVKALRAALQGASNKSLLAAGRILLAERAPAERSSAPVELSPAPVGLMSLAEANACLERALEWTENPTKEQRDEIVAALTAVRTAHSNALFNRVQVHYGTVDEPTKALFKQLKGAKVIVDCFQVSTLRAGLAANREYLARCSDVVAALITGGPDAAKAAYATLMVQRQTPVKSDSASDDDEVHSNEDRADASKAD